MSSGGGSSLPRGPAQDMLHLLLFFPFFSPAQKDNNVWPRGGTFGLMVLITVLLLLSRCCSFLSCTQFVCNP